MPRVRWGSASGDSTDPGNPSASALLGSSAVGASGSAGDARRPVVYAARGGTAMTADDVTESVSVTVEGDMTLGTLDLRTATRTDPCRHTSPPTVTHPGGGVSLSAPIGETAVTDIGLAHRTGGTRLLGHRLAHRGAQRRGDGGRGRVPQTGRWQRRLLQNQRHVPPWRVCWARDGEWRDRDKDPERTHVETRSSFRDLMARDLRPGCGRDTFGGNYSHEDTVVEQSCDVLRIMCAGDVVAAAVTPAPHWLRFSWRTCAVGCRAACHYPASERGLLAEKG